MSIGSPIYPDCPDSSEGELCKCSLCLREIGAAYHYYGASRAVWMSRLFWALFIAIALIGSALNSCGEI